LTIVNIPRHFVEIDGASAPREPILRIAGQAVAEMTEWSMWKLDEVYVAVLIGAVVVKVRDG
jgi:hypothetical protein